jgi:serine/threonine protein kinase
MYSDKKVILVDFDLAKLISPSKTSIYCKTLCGTEYFMAPESFDLKIYSKKSDIWSLGICFYKLITGKFPYLCEYDQTYNFYVRNCFQELNVELLDEHAKTYDDDIILIIKNMLQFIDDKRSSANTILNKLKEKKSIFVKKFKINKI